MKTTRKIEICRCESEPGAYDVSLRAKGESWWDAEHVGTVSKRETTPGWIARDWKGTIIASHVPTRREAIKRLVEETR